MPDLERRSSASFISSKLGLQPVWRKCLSMNTSNSCCLVVNMDVSGPKILRRTKHKRASVLVWFSRPRQAALADRKGREALLFVKKKKQKNFVNFGLSCFQRHSPSVPKVFAPLFSKSGCFLAS